MTARQEDDEGPTRDREARDEGPPALDPSTVEDDEALALAVDQVIQADPVARTRASEIAMHQAWLQAAVEDAGTWRLYLDVVSRQDQRWDDLSLAIAKWAFNEGRKHPLPLTQEGGRS